MIAYFIRKFPQLSETFIANEIVELGRQGIEPHIYSYKRPTEDVRHECVRLIRSPITYLPDPLLRNSFDIISAHLALRRADPERYRETFRYAMRIWKWKGQFRAYREFARAGWLAMRIKQDGITHIHSHMAHTATQVAMLVSMMTGIPYSFTAHAYDIYTANQADLKKRIDGANFIATCTGANVEHLAKLAGPEQAGKVRLQYHGVDLDRFSIEPIRQTDGSPLILAVGRLVEKKGFPDLLQACALLKARGKDFHCQIIGEGPDRKSLLKRIEELNIQDVVELPGAMSQEELIEVYRRAAAFALPCRVLEDGNRDGIPNVLMEAMAIGMPVVSSSVSGIPELVTNGENGLLVSQRNVEELADALQKLVDDPDLRERLSRNAKATVFEHFNSRACVRTLAGFLTESDNEPSREATAREMAEEGTVV